MGEIIGGDIGMRAFGNGHPVVCAQNLMRIHRGECPMDRLRGRNPKLLNTSRYQDVVSDAKLVIKLWEPRLDVTSVELKPIRLPDGDFELIMSVEGKEVDS